MHQATALMVRSGRTVVQPEAPHGPGREANALLTQPACQFPKPVFPDLDQHVCKHSPLDPQQWKSP